MFLIISPVYLTGAVHSIDSYLKDALGIDKNVKEELKEIFLYEEC